MPLLPINLHILKQFHLTPPHLVSVLEQTSQSRFNLWVENPFNETGMKVNI